MCYIRAEVVEKKLPGLTKMIYDRFTGISSQDGRLYIVEELDITCRYCGRLQKMTDKF